MPLAGQYTRASDVPVFAMAGGVGSVTLTASSSGSVAITFPAGVFSVAPLVFAFQTTLPASTGKFVMKCTGISTTGCSIYAYTGDLTTVTATADFDWVAVQMTSTSASG